MKTQTVLIVDDEEKNIKLMKAMLTAGNYQLHGVLSGEEALGKMADIGPDLILLDVMMPGVDGFEVCRRLKETEETRMVPIVMITALREKEHRIKAMNSGADDFLSKPVDQTELMVRVKSLLRIKSYHDDLDSSYREIVEKNEKLEELERVKEGLTHMIIHDLRNPLAAISGNLELVLMEKETLSDRLLKMLGKALNYCGDLRQMMQGLLDIHRMEEGALNPKKEVTDMAELIDEVLEQFIPKSEAKQISLSFPKPVNLPSSRVDPGLIKRVVANLLNNAIRHTSSGGKIEVVTEFLPEKESLCLSVKDNGSGLRPEYHQKIFDKFEQAELEQTGIKVGGSGLGLTFCKMAVEAHGGKIWMDSEGEGKGCTFSFVIPV